MSDALFTSTLFVALFLPVVLSICTEYYQCSRNNKAGVTVILAILTFLSMGFLVFSCFYGSKKVDFPGPEGDEFVFYWMFAFLSLALSAVLTFRNLMEDDSESEVRATTSNNLLLKVHIARGTQTYLRSDNPSLYFQRINKGESIFIDEMQGDPFFVVTDVVHYPGECLAVDLLYDSTDSSDTLSSELEAAGFVNQDSPKGRALIESLHS